MKPAFVPEFLWDLYMRYGGERGHTISVQFIKFATVGVINTVTTFVVYVILTRSVLSLHYLLAETIAYLCGTIVSFVLNRHWTFRKSSSTDLNEIARFYTTMFSSLLLNVGLLYVFVNIFGIYDIIAVVLSLVGTIIWNFIGMRLWVFR